MARLVGRGFEWGQLQAAWHSATQGRPHLVRIDGEAGIGKTRLAEELFIWAGQRGGITTRATSYAAERHLAYAPVIAWLCSDACYDFRHKLDDIWLTEM